MLEIRKKGAKNFLHKSEDLELLASDLRIASINNKVYFTRFNGAPFFLKEGYLISNISVYDDTNSGNQETFTNTESLFQRLITLGYPAFFEEGSVFWGNIGGDIQSQTDLINLFNGTDLQLSEYVSDCGQSIVLNKLGGRYTNIQSPNSVTQYNNPTGLVIGGTQETVISATTEPVIASQVDLTLIGTSGSARVTIGGNFYDITFSTDLNTTASNFVAVNGASISADTGLTVTNNSGVLRFVGEADRNIVISNLTGDLTGETTGVLCKKVNSDEFEADTKMELCATYNGVYVKYYFIKL